MALIQTRVSTKTEKWVERQAKKAGLSKAAWLRNHLVTLQEQAKLAEKIINEPGCSVRTTPSLSAKLDRLSRDEESE